MITHAGTYLLKSGCNIYHFLTYGEMIAWQIEKSFKEEQIFNSFFR